jgi:arylsulfatase A
MRSLLIVWIGLLTSHALATSDSRPNIIFILADDFGPGDIGCYGGKPVANPRIDQLGKEGIRFGQYYVASSIDRRRCAAHRLHP